MLSALSESGKTVQLIGQTREEIDQLKKERYYCPSCKEPVLIRAGSVVIPHFAHLPNSICPDKEGGEGTYHQTGKIHLYQWLKGQGYDVELEAYLKDIKKRPDILINWKGKQIALEFQCATIPQEDIRTRSEAYRKKGIYPFWVLGGRQLKRQGTSTIQLHNFHRQFLYNFGNCTLFYYDPIAFQFVVARHIQGTGSRTAFSDLRFFRLPSTGFPDLFAESKLPLDNFWNYWEKHVFRSRTHVKPYLSKQEKLWTNVLYQQGLHRSTLPTAAFLPVSSQVHIKDPPWIWQSRYLLDIYHPAPTGTILRKQHSPELHDLPHHLLSPDPLVEYLDLLSRLGFTKHVASGIYRKERELIFPKTVMDALQQDKIDFQKLKSQSQKIGTLQT
ncbi:competence protein CoiA [Thalassobacillus pellis]|uniref:competence protein CoiA n=1 Tax=Thalassobacillus pellis TaxID=748008 RepID=UPI001961D1CC|nr:competence protein CoiA family protein [Thalassobacillus pellis]MBM7554022.1 competence CoiA-like predicted nuclease [Thalassobacillus pellis]